jgi:major type 1 subunit fimbrin (pilin)
VICFLIILHIFNNENNLIMFKIFSRQKVFKMKKMNLMLLVTALGLVGMTNSAVAADGTITINGKVINGTCTLTGSAGATGTGTGVTVQLDTVRNTAFAAASSTTGEKNFTLTVTDGTGGTCDALTVGAVKNITLSGTSGTNYVATNPSWLINTDASAPTNKDVFVQILNVDGTTPIDFSLTRQLSASTTGAYALKARYISNKASPASQTVKTSINYTLEYN